jgi:triacylglycerol lipase
MRIALVHGFPGQGEIGPFEYFRGVEDHLRAEFPGLEVITPNLPAVGEADDRAEELEEDLEEATARLPAGDRWHLITHSGGGKDARLLVSPKGRKRSDLVRSITTISTPHHGSLIADGLADLIDLPFAVKALLEPFDDFRSAVKGFTSKGMAEFNREVSDSDEVKYFSYAGKVAATDPGVFLTPFQITQALIEKHDGDNDGWVSVRSSTPPNRTLTEVIKADHISQIGWTLSPLRRALDPGKHFDHLAFYQRIVKHLQTHG